MLNTLKIFKNSELLLQTMNEHTLPCPSVRQRILSQPHSGSKRWAEQLMQNEAKQLRVLLLV